jgi:hypothetical protein
MVLNTSYTFFCFLILFFSLRYLKIFKLEGLSKWDLSIGLLIKTIVSFVFIYIFSHYYGVGVLAFDSVEYFNDGKILNSVFYQSPINYFKLLTGIGEDFKIVTYYLDNTTKWYYGYTFFVDDAKNVIRLSSIIHFISGNSFYVQFLIFDLIALIGLVNIFKSIQQFSKLNNRVFFYLLIFSPSMLFWGSALLKEPILIFGIGLFLNSILNFKKFNILWVLKLLFSLLMLISIKPYVLFAVLLIFIILLIKFVLKLNYFFNFISILLLLIIIAFTFPSLRTKFVTSISFKQHDFINVGKGGIFCYDTLNHVHYNIETKDYDKIKYETTKITVLKPFKIVEINRFEKNLERVYIDSNSVVMLYPIIKLVPSNSYINVIPINDSFKQLILNVPSALINAILRPFPLDPGKNFKYFAFIETFLIFSFLIYSIINRKILNTKEKIIVYALFFAILFVSLIIGWTTPVLGAIVRYRIPVYLAILLICVIIINPPQRWKKEENIS